MHRVAAVKQKVPPPPSRRALKGGKIEVVFNDPHTCLRRILQAGQPLRSLSLHGILYRLCQAHAATLASVRGMESFSVAVEDRARRAPASGPGWVAKIVIDLAEHLHQPQERLLVASSAVLKALDEHHRDERPDRHLDQFSDSQGGLQTLFLTPPANWIAEQVPASRSLGRDKGHFEHDLRKILQLWWYVVPLEEHPAKPAPRWLELEAATDKRLSRRLDRNGDLRIALAAPLAESAYDFRSDPSRRHPDKGIPFRCVGLKPEHSEDSRKALDRIVEACGEHQVDILCFPELTLDNDLLRHLGDRLLAGDASRQPALTVAGSFHLGDAARWWNRCHVFDAWGELLFYQDKAQDFGFTPQNAHKMGAEQRADLGIDEGGGFEDIDFAKEILLVDSVLGRLVTPICLDYIGDGLLGLFRDTASNFFLVPAMTQRMDPFDQRAIKLGTDCRASSFVVNSAKMYRRPDAAPGERFLAYVPAKNGSAGTLKAWKEISTNLFMFSIRELMKEG